MNAGSAAPTPTAGGQAPRPQRGWRDPPRVQARARRPSGGLGTTARLSPVPAPKAREGCSEGRVPELPALGEPAVPIRGHGFLTKTTPMRGAPGAGGAAGAAGPSAGEQNLSWSSACCGQEAASQAEAVQ